MRNDDVLMNGLLDALPDEVGRYAYDLMEERKRQARALFFEDIAVLILDFEDGKPRHDTLSDRALWVQRVIERVHREWEEAADEEERRELERIATAQGECCS